MRRVMDFFLWLFFVAIGVVLTIIGLPITWSLFVAAAAFGAYLLWEAVFQVAEANVPHPEVGPNDGFIDVETPPEIRRAVGSDHVEGPTVS